MAGKEPKGEERRQFKRIQLAEDAIVRDSAGHELGRVVQAGGGGMLIAPASKEAADSLPVGKKLRVTIHEPASSTTTTIDVVVRYLDPAGVGVEFVTGKS